MREISIHAPDELTDALDEYQDTEGFVSRSEAGRDAIKSILRKRGYWPRE